MPLSTASNRLDELYRETRPDLLRYFRRRHGSDEAAEDLLQETFAAVMKNAPRVLAAESPRAYLFGVARHVSAEALRRARPTESLEGDESPELETEDPRLEPMREAIAGLNPVLRQVLHLRLQEELSYDEMARALGVPIGTIRSRLHHAVKTLAEAMKTTEDL
jgi:RNA polymerase sigma-70 factor (ECF subfamily)